MKPSTAEEERKHSSASLWIASLARRNRWVQTLTSTVFAGHTERSMMFVRIPDSFRRTRRPGQFAVLTPVPAIILFGPETSAPYGPLAENVFCFHQELSCAPSLTACTHRISPCDGDNQCLKQIALEQVLAKARAIPCQSQTSPA